MDEEKTSKIKSLKESLKVREKELLAAFKELDHYRRKCHKLKLLLFKYKSKPSVSYETLNTEQGSNELIQKKRPDPPQNVLEKPLKKLKTEVGDEEGEIKEPLKPKAQSKKQKKSQVTKFIESISPSSKEKTETPQESEDAAFEAMQKVLAKASQSKSPQPSKPFVSNPQGIAKPNTPYFQKTPMKNESSQGKAGKKAVAYNQPYSMETVYNEINYNSLKQQPIQYTPTTVSLSQASPLALRFKESFEMTKKLYSCDYDFNMANLSMLADTLKPLDSASAASYLISELMESAYLLSPGDALSILYGICKELVSEQAWGKKFLSAFIPFFIKTTQDIAFGGKNTKLPALKYPVSTLQEVLHACFMTVTLMCGHLDLVVKLISKLIICKSMNLVKLAFSSWSEAINQDYALQIFYRLVVKDEHFWQLAQEISLKSVNSDEKTWKSFYIGLKTILRYVSIEQGYEIYKQLLWPSFPIQKEGFFRVLVIRLIGILYQEIEKDGTKKVHNQLRGQLEEILTDTDNSSNFYVVFSVSEQQAAVLSLEKIGCQSKILQNFKKLHGLVKSF